MDDLGVLLFRVKRQKQSGKKPSGQQRSQKTTQNIQKSQLRYTEQSKVQKTGREIGPQVARENTGSSTKGLG